MQAKTTLGPRLAWSCVRGACQVTSFVELIFGKAVAIAAELRVMIDSVHTSCEKLEDVIGVGSYTKCYTFAKKLAFLNFVNFYRRVVYPLSKHPYRLLLLAKARPNVECDERRIVCREVLSASNESLHCNALKIKMLFRSQLEQCAVTGCLGVSLWVPIRLVCLKLSGSSQEMEAVNKLIKNACKMAPTISLPVLDARRL